MICTPEKSRTSVWITGLLAMLVPLLVPVSGSSAAGPPVPGAGQIASARAHLARGDGIAAEMDLRRALAAGAPRQTVAARMGEAFIIQGDLRQAREWLADGQFARSEAAHGWRMTGMLDRLDGNLAAAGKDYDRALAIAPRDAVLWVDIGRLRYAGGEQLQALEAADWALRLDPANVRALEFRAQLIRDQFGLAASLPWFEAALARSPDDLSVLGEYAATLGEIGRARDMLTITRRMIELEPRNPRAFYLQAVLAARAGNIALARSLFNRTGGRLRNVPAAMLLEACLEMQAGNLNLAIEQLDRLARLQPGNGRVQLLLARAYALAGEDGQLVERFADAAARPDAPPYLLVLLGQALENLDRRDRAAPLLDRAANAGPPPLYPIAEPDPIGVLALRWRDDPSRPAAAVPYIRQLLAARRLAEAEAITERLRAAYPGAGDAQALAGDVQLAMGHGAAAVDRYRIAARVRMSDSLLLRMAAAMAREGRGAQAWPVIDTYLSQNPSSTTALRLAAAGAGLGRDWKRSRILLEHLRAAGGARDARLLADLSYAQLQAGDASAAVETAGEAYRLQRASAVVAQAYGMALAAQGKHPDLARALLEKARRIDSAGVEMPDRAVPAQAARQAPAGTPGVAVPARPGATGGSSAGRNNDHRAGAIRTGGNRTGGNRNGALRRHDAGASGHVGQPH